MLTCLISYKASNNQPLLQSDPGDGGIVQGDDGVPRRVLSEARGEGHQGPALKVGKIQGY